MVFLVNWRVSNSIGDKISPNTYTFIGIGNEGHIGNNIGVNGEIGLDKFIGFNPVIRDPFSYKPVVCFNYINIRLDIPVHIKS